MPRRSAIIPDVPTFREQGYDVLMDGWYAFVGPKGMTAAQVTYWDDAFLKTVNHADWKKFIDNGGWEWGYKNARDTLAHLQKEYDQSRALLTELGMAK